MAVSIGSNISAALAQRMLGRASSAQSASLERLSSGLRINRASDDAAGLAISSTLAAHSRVYGQGLRNANDAISLLNVADGALGESTSILERLRELATSAANGTYSTIQRRALDREALELQREYNRITETTTFNGLSLANGKLGRLNIQTGFGSSGTLGFDLGDQFSRAVGTGAYQTTVNFQTTGSQASQPPQSGDFNGDGKSDLFNGGYIYLSNGDGTFSQGQELNDSDDSALADFNRDGRLDIIAGGNMFLGIGDGTFVSGSTVAASGGTNFGLLVGDFNGDGNLDIVGSDAVNGSLQFGNGDGTFKNTITVGNLGAISQVGDFNNDGRTDIVSSNGAAAVTVKLSSGNGTFVDSSIAVGPLLPRASVLDLNNDGFLDLITTTLGGALNFHQGRGDGSFEAAQTLFGSGVSLQLFSPADLNNDGYQDLVGQNGTILMNNGDGTLAVSTVGSFLCYAADVNGDGVVDLVDYDEYIGDSGVHFGNTSRSSRLERLNLTTRSEALASLSTVDRALSRTQLERGQIGSMLSRLSSATRTLGDVVDNYTAARSRIVDADVASESSQLTRTTILQQAAQAVLAQANQLPALALTLLRGN